MIIDREPELAELEEVFFSSTSEEIVINGLHGFIKGMRGNYGESAIEVIFEDGRRCWACRCELVDYEGFKEEEEEEFKPNHLELYHWEAGEQDEYYYTLVDFLNDDYTDEML